MNERPAIIVSNIELITEDANPIRIKIKPAFKLNEDQTKIINSPNGIEKQTDEKSKK